MGGADGGEGGEGGGDGSDGGGDGGGNDGGGGGNDGGGEGGTGQAVWQTYLRSAWQGKSFHLVEVHTQISS